MESFDADAAASREEFLEGGLVPGRKAHALLSAIENRTAQLVSQSQAATALYLTQKAVEERESAFLDALAAGRDLPVQPTIQHLERQAPHWANLVSKADASLLAALAHAQGRQYTLTAEVYQIFAAGQLAVQPVIGQGPISLALHTASVHVPATRASELKTWVHKITPEWRSETLPALLCLECGSETKEFDLALHERQVILPITAEACQIEITLAETSLS